MCSEGRGRGGREDCACSCAGGSRNGTPSDTNRTQISTLAMRIPAQRYVVASICSVIACCARHQAMQDERSLSGPAVHTLLPSAQPQGSRPPRSLVGGLSPAAGPSSVHCMVRKATTRSVCILRHSVQAHQSVTQDATSLNSAAPCRNDPAHRCRPQALAKTGELQPSSPRQ